jgi:hypothetical protein
MQGIARRWEVGRWLPKSDCHLLDVSGVPVHNVVGAVAFRIVPDEAHLITLYLTAVHIVKLVDIVFGFRREILFPKGTLVGARRVWYRPKLYGDIHS